MSPVTAITLPAPRLRFDAAIPSRANPGAALPVVANATQRRQLPARSSPISSSSPPVPIPPEAMSGHGSCRRLRCSSPAGAAGSACARETPSSHQASDSDTSPSRPTSIASLKVSNAHKVAAPRPFCPRRSRLHDGRWRPPRADERRDWLRRNCWTYHPQSAPAPWVPAGSPLRSSTRAARARQRGPLRRRCLGDARRAIRQHPHPDRDGCRAARGDAGGGAAMRGDRSRKSQRAAPIRSMATGPRNMKTGLGRATPGHPLARQKQEPRRQPCS